MGAFDRSRGWQLPTPGRAARFCIIAIFAFASCWVIYGLSTGQDLLAPLQVISDQLPSRLQPGATEGTPSDSQDMRPGLPPAPVHNNEEYFIPPGLRIFGLVFFGRKETVEILDCYLRRNLKVNGGLLEEVIFAVNTDNEADLAYLEELLAVTPQYRKFVAEKQYEAWTGQWQPANIRDAVYVKIDDDVVYFEDHTIATVVSRLLESQNYFAVSANVVNNPALSWVHSHLGVHYPYWPEMKEPRSKPKLDWRASKLPSYDGPLEGPEDFAKDGSTPAPFEGHRWLPVRLPAGERYDMELTPISTLTYDAFGPSLHNWAAGAQGHYSFLQRLEEGSTWKYKFDMWDYQFARLSINFFAIRGADIIDVFPFPIRDDEHYLTVERPKQLNRKVLVDGRGLAVHFAFGPQRSAHDGHSLGWTDGLGRYGLYAKETVCMALPPPPPPPPPSPPPVAQ